MRNSPHICLIDADLWCYDAAFAAQRKQEDGSIDVLPFSYAKNIIDIRFETIMKKLKCTEYEFYLTGENNFRHEVATIQKYKGNRKQDKPWHLQNLRNYLMFAYDAEVIDGMEADDMLAIRQKECGDASVIVSRDKDLRICEGWHYSYAVGGQPEKDLEWIDELGYILLDKKDKLRGGGLRFFYAQCLMGDKTDNILGIPRFGDVKAYNVLKDCNTEEELHKAVLEVYTAKYGEDAYDTFRENATLLWMCNDTNTDGTPKLWEDKWTQQPC